MNDCAPCFTLAIAFLLMAVTISPVDAQQDEAPAAGVAWEVTSQVTMEGMPLNPPAQTQKVCAPVVWTKPPGTDNDERGCVNSNFERFDNTVTWTSACAGPPEMAGQGEIVFADETAQGYTGRIEYASDDGHVVIMLGGRVVGTCDKPR